MALMFGLNACLACFGHRKFFVAKPRVSLSLPPLAPSALDRGPSPSLCQIIAFTGGREGERKRGREGWFARPISERTGREGGQEVPLFSPGAARAFVDNCEGGEL